MTAFFVGFALAFLIGTPISMLCSVIVVRGMRRRAHTDEDTREEHLVAALGDSARYASSVFLVGPDPDRPDALSIERHSGPGREMCCGVIAEGMSFLADELRSRHEIEGCDG